MGEDREPLLKRIDQLLEQFPWGASGFPSRPSAGTTARQTVEDWLSRQTLLYKTQALTLVRQLHPVLRRLQSEVEAIEGRRFFARIDPSNLTKSGASILEKMARLWNNETKPPVAFGNLHELDDLGRFRIVTNFLSDAIRVQEALTTGEVPGFEIHRNNFDDEVELEPRERKSGHRCYKGHFHPIGQPQVKVEVQIMTQLQDAWDRKDHSLVYEPMRCGQSLELADRCQMFAMSELLYVADQSFDRLRWLLLDRRGG